VTLARPRISPLPPLHVVLNALFLDPGASGGPETYLSGLVPALRQIRPEGRLTVISTRRGAAALRADGWPEEGIEVRQLACDDGERVRRQLAEQVALPVLARHLRADVLHSLASIAPIRAPGLAHVITVHDVNFIHHSTFNAVTSWGMAQVVPRAARHADALIADTAVSRDDVCATLGLNPADFTVVPLGAESPERSRPAPEAELRRRFGLGDGRVVVCVGAKRPHKNQAVLVRALPHLPGDVRLVLAGHAEPYEETLRAQARELGVAGRVVFAGWVADADLEGLWALAEVAALPTLAEGFGLPLIEAMARGVPVAASELPVLREVGGDWPAYFDPRDPADAARAIRTLLRNPPDTGAGRRWAQRYTWPTAAAATWAVYDRAVERRRERRLAHATTAV
jgi:glycosyltransferase involved in cell wall biosynthesis